MRLLLPPFLHPVPLAREAGAFPLAPAPARPERHSISPLSPAASFFGATSLRATLARVAGLVLAVGLVVTGLGARPTLAQDGATDAAALSGYVTDAATGETLIFANVLVADTTSAEGASRGVATNNEGYYTLTGLAPGTYRLTVSYVGYRTFRDTVVLAPGARRRLDVELTPEDFVGEGVTITAEAEGQEDARALGVARVPTQDITRLPAVLEPDVFRALQLLPGVQAASDYSSGLYIRGGTPDQTLILLDNTTVYNPTHFFGFFSTFNPDAIKDVRLYKGAYPAEYGGRLGSVVSIYNKDGNRRQTRGGLSVGLLASRAFVEGPFAKDDDGRGRGSYMLAVRRSTLEPLLAALRSSDTEGIPDGFYFYDVNAKVGYDLGPNDKLALASYVGQDVLDLPIADDAAIDVRYGNRTLSLGWTHLFSSQLFSDFTVTGSQYLSTPEAQIAGTAFEQRNEVVDLSLKADLEYVPGARHTVQAGAWGGTLAFTLDEAFDGNETFAQDIRSAYASAYVQETFEPSPQWQIRGGARLNYFQSGSFWRLAPRLGAEYRPAQSVRLQLGYGRYYQFLTLDTSEFFTGFDQWLMSAEGVPPAFGDQLVAGLKLAPADGWLVDVELYGRTMRGLFEPDRYLLDQAGVPYAQTFAFGEGVAVGIETFVQKTKGRLTGSLSYAFAPTGRRFPFVNGAGVVAQGPANTSSGPLGDTYPPGFDRRHSLTLTGTAELGRSWRLTGVFNYFTGQPFSEPVQRYALTNDPFQVEDRNVLVAPFNGARLPAYHRLDLGATREGRFFGIADYELQLQVVNVYSRRNIWFFLYEFEDGTVDRTDVPQIPVPIPNVAFTLRF